jgi:hypothetical protein
LFPFGTLFNVRKSKFVDESLRIITVGPPVIWRRNVCQHQQLAELVNRDNEFLTKLLAARLRSREFTLKHAKSNHRRNRYTITSTIKPRRLKSVCLDHATAKYHHRRE